MRRLCKVLEVHPSGFYAWRLNPESKRTREDKRLLVPIKESWLESGSVYGYRKVSDDLRELGEQCGVNRVHRLMRSAGIRSQTGYAKRKYKRGGAPSLVAPNHLQRQFDVQEPIASGSRTSPTSAPMRAGCIWPWCLICSRARLLAGR